MRVTDFLGPAHRLLDLQTIDRRLHRGVGRSLALGKEFLDFTNRKRAASPERFHDLQIQFAEAGNSHESFPTTVVCDATTGSSLKQVAMAMLRASSKGLDRCAYRLRGAAMR